MYVKNKKNVIRMKTSKQKQLTLKLYGPGLVI